MHCYHFRCTDQTYIVENMADTNQFDISGYPVGLPSIGRFTPNKMITPQTPTKRQLQLVSKQASLSPVNTGIVTAIGE